MYAICGNHPDTSKVIATNPYNYQLSTLVALAKAADVPIYPGHAGGPVYLGKPESQVDLDSMMALLTERNLLW